MNMPGRPGGRNENGRPVVIVIPLGPPDSIQLRNLNRRKAYTERTKAGRVKTLPYGYFILVFDIPESTEDPAHHHRHQGADGTGTTKKLRAVDSRLMVTIRRKAEAAGRNCVFAMFVPSESSVFSL